MTNWLAGAEAYLHSRPNIAIAAVAAVVLLALIAWIWGPALLTSRHKYESRRERVEDADRYRRNIGQLLTIPILLLAILYTLHQVAGAARRSVEKSDEERFSQGSQALASGNVSIRLGGIHALAQLMGGDRPEALCPDGNQRPLSSSGGGADPDSADARRSPQDQLYRAALQAIAAQAVTSSRLARLGSEGDAARQALEAASHEVPAGADTYAALSVIARRKCEPYSQEVPLDLSHGYFRGASMAHAQLIRSDLRGSDFSASELALANLYQASLDGADFGGANLTRASFANASMTDANFGPGENLASPALPRLPHLRTQLGRAQIVTANAQGADFRCAMMNEARLDDSQLGGADFEHAALSRATFLSAKGVGARFNAACGPRANFSSATFASVAAPIQVEGRKSDFSGADFSDGFFRSARFDRIRLQGAIFVRADLANATFENSDLTNADFRGANLTGAKFDGANLIGVKLGGATVCNVSGLPDVVVSPRCELRFMPVEAGRFGDDCLPTARTGIGVDQQCPYDGGEVVEMAEPPVLSQQ
ncbi:pentapeptide repeat-containing protein [Inquilinus sp. NPDC058860]|uniref:pentapeptide repeat-containing protein n=1 Tax=Inquilinus sp. NPDC058860 TaxID=3346652 RepID=UPI0036BE4046